jgi:cytochrome c
MKRILLTLCVLMALRAETIADGNPTRGQGVFGACAACHSLQADQNMTGPSLAGVWGRKAGTLPSFDRYSEALKSSGITWNDATLDAWIKDPQQLVPRNQMTFAGLKDAAARADLLAFLKQAHKGPQTAQGGMGGMGGMMGGGQAPNLKKLDPEDRVVAISYCKDSYAIQLGNGKTQKFWERNLRFKTDGGAEGPEKNSPALVPAGMMGDRADVIFAAPSEISTRIVAKCD